MQKTLLIGYLGKDPEMKYTAGGTAIATFTLGVDKDINEAKSLYRIAAGVGHRESVEALNALSNRK